MQTPNSGLAFIVLTFGWLFGSTFLSVFGFGFLRFSFHCTGQGREMPLPNQAFRTQSLNEVFNKKTSVSTTAFCPGMFLWCPLTTSLTQAEETKETQ